MEADPPDKSEHLYYPFAVRVLITVGISGTFVLLILLIWRSTTVLLLIFAGFLLSIILRWLQTQISRFARIPHGLALVLSLSLFFLLLGLFGMYFGPLIKEQVVDLYRRIPEYFSDLKYYLEQFSWGKEVLEQAEAPEALISAKNLQETELLSRIIGVFSTTFGAISGVLFILVIGVYLAAQPGIYLKGILRLIPLNSRPRAIEVFHNLSTAIRGWLLGQLFSMSILGTIVGSGLWLLGLPNALALGLFAALMTFIPNLGPVLAFIPAILVALSQGIWTAVYVSLFYVFVQNVEGYFLTPKIQEKIISVPAVLILSVQILLFNIIGFLGILLAMPLLACTMVLIQMLYVEDVLGDRLDEPVLNKKIRQSPIER